MNYNTHGLDLGSMRGMKLMYDNGDEPEAGSSEHLAYNAYKSWADNLKMTGREMYLDCLSCPGMFRTLDQDIDMYGSETYSECEMDCAMAYRDCELESYGYREILFDYYMGIE